ncbi:MAG: CAP domain-containing protein [Myxococcales bacterium]|nr:CAP domain-containing protein [Myxococcales bacterium]
MRPIAARWFGGGVGLLVGLWGATACNLITGASDLEVSDDAGEGGGSESASGSGAGETGPSGSGPSGSGPSGSGSTGSGVTCGDATCSPGEDCLTCAADCGACAATCGDATCQPDETCVSCPQDCGTCPAMCGNAVCEAGEDCASCAADCGACPPTCGNATCDAGEDCMSCPGDCGMCGPSCGDGMCNGAEDCSTCASDCGACPTCGGAGDATTPLDAEEQAFLGIINTYRAQNGLGALAACTSLNRAAQGHSEDMRDNNYFSHTGLNGSTPWDRSCDACYELGCGPQTAMAENIAAGNSGAQATFDQWKNSPGHNANMLGSSFTMIGIGRATGGGQYGSYWTNVFGGATEPSCN